MELSKALQISAVENVLNGGINTPAAMRPYYKDHLAFDDTFHKTIIYFPNDNVVVVWTNTFAEVEHYNKIEVIRAIQGRDDWEPVDWRYISEKTFPR
jgi:hypothetical protein